MTTTPKNSTPQATKPVDELTMTVYFTERQLSELKAGEKLELPLTDDLRQAILSHIDTVCREAVKKAVDYYAWRFECNTAVSEMYGWKGTLETAKEQTLKHFEATLNVNTKDGE